ncbi:hypothetical protein RintRC_4063 [Richelia intracellularis]|nr:hypothetical protein RintRC_4063 [Richelia intracellularis]
MPFTVPRNYVSCFGVIKNLCVRNLPVLNSPLTTFTTENLGGGLGGRFSPGGGV